MNLTILEQQLHSIQDPIVKTCFIYYEIFYTLGFFLNALLLILWWRNRENDIDQFAIFIIITDCISGITCFMFWKLSIYMNWMASGIGAVGCIFAGTLSYITTITTMFSLFLYAYQRYRIVSQKIPLPLRKAAFMYLAFLATTSFFISFPAIMGENPGYDLGPSGSYCMINWSHRSTASLVVIIYTVIATSGTLTGIIFVYYKILAILYSFSKKENMDRQRVLVRRVIIMVAVNVISFTPYTLCIIYELFSGTRVSPGIDAFATVSFVTNMFFDFILFISINTFYRNLFWGLFGISFGKKEQKDKDISKVSGESEPSNGDTLKVNQELSTKF